MHNKVNNRGAYPPRAVCVRRWLPWAVALLATQLAFGASIPRDPTPSTPISPSDPLFKQQGGGAPTEYGDYVSVSDSSTDGGNGLAGPYRYYIEVPASTSRLVVDIFDADVGAGGTGEADNGRDRARGSWDTSVSYRLFDPGGTQVTTNFSTGNTSTPSGADNAWLTLYDSNTAPTAGHWLLEVDSSTSTGNDIIAYGVRAHDSDTSSGGTEIPIYTEPYLTFGVNNDAGNGITDTDTFITYPYLVGGCTVDSNDFDMDTQNSGDQGQTQLATRQGSTILNVDDASLSVNDVWNTNSSSAFDTNPFQNTDHGIGRGEFVVSEYGSASNYTVWYLSDPNTTSIPPSSLMESSSRIYFPPDGAGTTTAPVKPYLEQELTYVSGPASPTVGQTTVVQITVRVVNPTAHAITFSTPNDLVTAIIPDNSGRTTYAGSADSTDGTGAITSTPAVGNPGDITWNPGTVAAGATEILTYRVDITPQSGDTTIYVTGQTATNGTEATWLDETGNITQTRATFTFGQLCGLSATVGTSITYVSLSSFRAYSNAGGARVEWETAGEAGTAGFALKRRDSNSGKFKRVPGGRIRGLLTAPDGGTYSVLDPDAVSGQSYTYKLIEIQTNGRRRSYGPFTVTVDGDPAELGAKPEQPQIAGLQALGNDPNEENESAGEGEGVSRKHRSQSKRAKWRAQRVRQRTQQAKANKRGRRGAEAKIVVTETGLYQVTVAEIAAAIGRGNNKVRKAIRRGQLRISNRGQPVQYRVLDKGESLAFFGEAIDSPYSNENIYWIGKGAGANRMAEEDQASAAAQNDQTFTESVHVEQDVFAGPIVAVNRGKSFWYWKVLAFGSSQSFDVPAPGVAPSGNATLKVHVQGWLSGPALNEQSASVYVNGTLVGNGVWNDATTHTLTFQFDQVLLTTNNTIEVVSAPTSGYYLDGFDLSYQRQTTAENDFILVNNGMDNSLTLDGFLTDQIQVYDVSNSKTPSFLRHPTIENASGGYRVSFPAVPGAKYLALGNGQIKTPLSVTADSPSKLKRRRNHADYLVITPEVLKASADALAAYRAATDGLRTQVVLLQDVYDEFNFGLKNPYAVRDFLRYAYQNWRRVPRYVVFLGKGTYDYKDVMNQGTNLFPPIILSTPDGMFAADNFAFDVVGDDGVPEFAGGRIPVTSDAEFNAYLNKLTLSEGNGGPWGNNVILSAEVKDGAADFKGDAQIMAGLLNGQNLTELYLDDIAIGQARTDLFAGLNDAGASVYVHVGHGGMDRLASAGLLTTPDVDANLTNASQLPFLVALSCLINRYEIPGIDPVLGEEMILDPNAGAAVVWEPTGTSTHANAVLLGQKLFYSMFNNSTGRAGDVVVESLQAFQDELGGNATLFYVYTLLGDPAARIAGLPAGTQRGPKNTVKAAPTPSPPGE